ncbi:MAG: DNA alkylation repair protein [bacterium]|nr:DNA alkylation repair protein [bacterium]
MSELLELKKELRSMANPEKAKLLQGFFKTGRGEYGEGDIFLGVTVPELRKISGKYVGLNLTDVIKLLHSEIHEERLAALLVMIDKFQAGEEQEKIYNLYLQNTEYINNWDLVDLSAHKIVGAHLSDKPKSILIKLARSRNFWERRIAVIATFYFIKNNEFSEAVKIAEMLLSDGHDLIQKAVGWMLREVGKRDLKIEEKFLKEYCKKMPRTMLRYAIEKFPERKRKRYLKKGATSLL